MAVSRLLYADDVGHAHRPYAPYRLIFYECRNEKKRAAPREGELIAPQAPTRIREKETRERTGEMADMPKYIPGADPEACVSYLYIDSGLSEIEQFLRAWRE